jgi:hypothetical protein
MLLIVHPEFVVYHWREERHFHDLYSYYKDVLKAINEYDGQVFVTRLNILDDDPEHWILYEGYSKCNKNNHELYKKFRASIKNPNCKILSQHLQEVPECDQIFVGGGFVTGCLSVQAGILKSHFHKMIFLPPLCYQYYRLPNEFVIRRMTTKDKVKEMINA